MTDPRDPIMAGPAQHGKGRHFKLAINLMLGKGKAGGGLWGGKAFTLLIIKLDLASLVQSASQCASKDRYSSIKIPRNV